MPTYEYKCHDCGNKFEEFQQMIDPPVSSCPKCEGKVERLISGGSGLIFRGSGFYTTDYRSDSYKKAAEKEKRPEPKADSSSSKEDKKSKDKTQAKNTPAS
jgi:putative FmdB family regulatory protein